MENKAKQKKGLGNKDSSHEEFGTLCLVQRETTLDIRTDVE